MGLLSYFRKQPSTADLLEDITKRIDKLQKSRRQTQEKQKKFIASLILYSIVVYISAALIFYFYYLPDTWRLQLLYSLPLLIFPFLVWGLKRLLHWYFVKRIANNDIQLGLLREKKKQILEEVMEKETYKKAREILEKYDPDRFKKIEPSPEKPDGTVVRRKVTTTTGVMQTGPRAATSMTGGPRAPGTTPLTSRPRLPQIQQDHFTPQTQHIVNGYGHPPGPPLPRPILPRERKIVDKMLDYLVGDGPENRYALICRYCHSHNGMALKEEFEYISFRCCYCYSMNPAKKTRPNAPKLEFPSPAPKTSKPQIPEKKTPALQQHAEDENESGSEDEYDDETNTEDTSPENEKSIVSESESTKKIMTENENEILQKTPNSPMEVDPTMEEIKDKNVSESPDSGSTGHTEDLQGDDVNTSAEMDFSEFDYIDSEPANDEMHNTPLEEKSVSKIKNEVS